jgi:hypothetical protein
MTQRTLAAPGPIGRPKAFSDDAVLRYRLSQVTGAAAILPVDRLDTTPRASFGRPRQRSSGSLDTWTSRAQSTGRARSGSS